MRLVDYTKQMYKSPYAGKDGVPYIITVSALPGLHGEKI
jgi:hypothetical protein